MYYSLIPGDAVRMVERSTSSYLEKVYCCSLSHSATGLQVHEVTEIICTFVVGTTWYAICMMFYFNSSVIMVTVIL